MRQKTDGAVAPAGSRASYCRVQHGGGPEPAQLRRCYGAKVLANADLGETRGNGDIGFTWGG